jgi:glycosyltransferase involved in cell wall biosynthesis
MDKNNKKNYKVSVAIIAKNEEGMIGEGIKSSLWADEVVVLDTGSTDKTAIISKRLGAKVYKMATEGLTFADWRTELIKKAQFDWIFYLDSDERFTKGSEKEIREIINTKGEIKTTHYAVARENYYLGKRVHWGGSWPDYVIRLFYKPALKKWTKKLHEEPICTGEIGYLKAPIKHFTHKDITSMVEKTIKWSGIEAELLFKANHPPVVWWRFLRMMVTKAWERLVKQQAWRDGTVGWINSIFEVFNTFIIYARLWEMQQESKRK